MNEAGVERPPEEVKRILKERAQALARPLEAAPNPTEVLELLVFALGGERYGIETAHVLEVVPLRELTPVPSTPPFVLGVVNHRGRILPVLDLRRLLDLAGQEVTEGSRVVAVRAGGMTFGIFADAVTGVVRVRTHEAASPPGTLTGNRPAFIRGVTGEMVAVLDLEALARDPRIAVNEEIG
jgi:purine-binding chemotaxis protein CheW